MHPIHKLLAAIGLLATTLPALAGTPLPVRALSSTEIAALTGMPYLDPGSQAFTMTAGASSQAFNKISTQGAQRTVGGTAAVYRGAPTTTVPLLPPMPPGESVLDMITVGDSAQSWATMTAAGVPHVFVTGYGAFGADATAAWTTSITVPAGAAGRELVVRFVIPPVSVAGATEQQGQAYWRAKLRAELLVNGFPAWSTEAFRFTLDPSQVAFSLEQLLLQQFGAGLPFPANDTGQAASSALVAYLTLGRFNPGAVVDLSMIVRGTAVTVPQAPGGTDNRCAWNHVRYFCSRATVVVDGASGEPPRIYLLP